MWKLYLSNNEGIAIQSTFQRLLDSLSGYDDYDVFIGKITYIDFDKESIPMKNLLSPYLYKRKSFAHEDELRALIWTLQHGKNDPSNRETNKYKDTFGLYVLVDLDKLIERVYVAPTAPRWIVEMIESLISKYGLQKQVMQSILADKPLYWKRNGEEQVG